VKLAAAAALLAAAWAALAQTGGIAPFSASAPGARLPAGWEQERIARVPPAEVALVDDGGTTVLQVSSHGAAGAAAFELHADAHERPLLSWRWKVDRVVAGADLARRDADDFAARVYVFFDVPLGTLPFATRFKIRVARLIYGEDLPTAGICYVWDNRHAPGTAAWSPYTDRVRIVVVQSGAARAGEWVEAARDLEADFRAAFGAQAPGPVPAVTGLAAGNDTDQTGESATARFGDFRLEARR
jgi:hypothetical protein